MFVAHTDLAKLACDLVLIPTDVNLYVTAGWQHFGWPAPACLPRGWSNSGVRVTNAVPEASPGFGRLVHWVNTGTIPGWEDVAWLREGVRQGLDAAGASLRGRQPQFNRTRMLVGLPLFGTGAGGFDEIRGQVLDGILSECGDAVGRHGYDVVIACLHRSDYAALQNRRLESAIGSPALPDGLTAQAGRLGGLARDGNLVLFLGAGLSQPAGLPSWSELIGDLAKESHSYADKVKELNQIAPTDAASLLEQDLDSRFHEILRAKLSGKPHPLGHALLASLRVAEAITTNFDTLYEQACDRPFDHRLRKLPWQAAEPGQPWLLKMHGDIDTNRLVFTWKDYLHFDTYWRPLASMLQAAMMTRHVLFIGFSLKDENFIRLGHDVGLLLKRMGHSDNVGTVLTLHKDPLRAELWQPYLQFAEMSGPHNADDAARVHDIFLDLVAMNAAVGEVSYLLDPRYRFLVGNADSPVFTKLMELGEAVDAEHDDCWSDVAELLKRYGYHSF